MKQRRAHVDTAAAPPYGGAGHAERIMGPRSRQVWIIVLLGVGVAMWLWVERRAAVLHGHGLGPVRWLLSGAAAAAACLPAVRRAINHSLDRIREPSPQALERATVAISFAAACYFVFTAIYQGRDLFPKTHDEGSYVIGLRMLARGRLWMPQHLLADFFDTFYVLVRPVYASLYFPGTALLNVPGHWLGWPTWVMPVLMAGAVVGLVYRLFAELMDGVAGALAAMLLVSLSWYRMLSVLVFSQVPLLLLALLLIWAWLRWRRYGTTGWALAIGAFAGWAAIVRPLDALCYAAPVGVAILYDLRRFSSRRRFLTPVVMIVGAMPFLLLQLYFNHNVTGRLTETPYTFYLQRDQPGTSFGFHAYDPSDQPQSRLAQKRDYYAGFMTNAIREHQPDTFLQTWATKSLPMLLETTLPVRFLIALVPIGLLGLTNARRLTLAASLPLFVVGYALNPFFLEHYAMAAAPAVLLLLLLGLKALAGAWPRWRDHVTTAGVMILATVTVMSLYEVNPVATALDRRGTKHLHEIDDETFRSPVLRAARDAEALVEKPAVILFRYSAGENVIEEPVYNTGVAWPDDALVIRAHDLGERNGEIYAYYAERQPNRMFYRFDRATLVLTPLGRAKDLATARPTSGTGAQ